MDIPGEDLDRCLDPTEAHLSAPRRKQHHTFSQGKYEEAKLKYQRSLAIREKAHGSDHPDVATSLNNLACVLNVQVRFDPWGQVGRSMFVRVMYGVG